MTTPMPYFESLLRAREAAPHVPPVMPTFDELIAAGIKDAEEHPERYSFPRHARRR